MKPGASLEMSNTPGLKIMVLVARGTTRDGCYLSQRADRLWRHFLTRSPESRSARTALTISLRLQGAAPRNKGF